MKLPCGFTVISARPCVVERKPRDSGLLPAGIEDDDVDLALGPGHLLQDGLQRDRLDIDIALAG